MAYYIRQPAEAACGKHSRTALRLKNMTLISLGLNHHTAPLELREKIALNDDELSGALAELRAQTGCDEAVIVSTCNRFEVFSFAHRERRAAIADWICTRSRLPHAALQDHWCKLHGIEVAHHLMKIACGLDSVIVGEPQILGQVKSAYRIAQQDKHTGAVTGRLFEAAIAAAKQVRTQTELGRHPISYASITLDTSRRLFENLADRHALIIGIGEMTELAARHFKENGIGAITIVNRTLEKAAPLAAEVGADTVPLDALEDVLHRCDIIISCTASHEPIIGKEMVVRALKRRKRQLMHITDLALPRDVDPQVGKLESVYLHTLDNLAQMIDANQKLRMAAGGQAEAIIARCAGEFMGWLNARQAAPLVALYRSGTEELCEQALKQALVQLENGRTSAAVVRELAHTLGKRLMHPTTEIISAAGATGNKELLAIIKAALEK